MLRPATGLLVLALFSRGQATFAQEAPTTATPTPAPTPEPLSARNQRWLDQEAVHAITAYETAVYASLPDRDRAAFARAFWEARDPSPKTRDNPRRKRHLERLAAARALFAGPREQGWEQRPRVRLYSQLGPPDERQSYPGVDGLWPLELWTFRDPTDLGLPPWLQLLFYRPGDDADWALYDPVGAGPPALARAADVEREAALALLEAAGAELRTAAVSLTPTELGAASVRIPTSDVVSILADLGNRQEVDLGWVRRHLGATGKQALLADLDRHEVGASFHGAWLPGGAGMLQYAVEVPASRITLVEVDDEFRGALEVVARISTAADGRTVQWIDRRVGLSLSRSALAQVEDAPLAIEDVVPMLPGEYEVDLYLRDRVSRFAVFLEGNFRVPEPPTGKALAVGRPLIVARQLASDGGVLRPFAFADRVVYPAVGGKVHPRAHELDFVFQVAHVGGGVAGRTLRIQYRVLLGDVEVIAGFDRMSIDARAPPGIEIGSVSCLLPQLALDDYRLEIEVSSDALQPASARTEFVATPAIAAASPWLYAHELTSDLGQIDFQLSLQAERLGQSALADAYRRRSLQQPGVNAEVRLYHALRRLASGDASGAVSALEPLADTPHLAAAVSRMSAEAQAAMGHAALARAAWEAALERSPRSVQVLNRLTDLATASGDNAAAIDWLRRSLEIEPAQRDQARKLRALEDAARRRER